MQKLSPVLAVGHKRGRGQQEETGKRTILFFSKGEAPLTGRVASAISVMFAGFWIDFEDRRARTEGVYEWYGGDVWRKGRAGCLYFFFQLRKGQETLSLLARELEASRGVSVGGASRRLEAGKREVLSVPGAGRGEALRWKTHVPDEYTWF